VVQTTQELATPQELAEQGRNFYRQGQLGEALQCLEAAFKGDDRNYDIAYGLGRIHEMKGDKEGLALALRYFQRADELYATANGLGKHFGPTCACWAYCLNRTGHPAEAIVAYEFAIQAGYDTAEVENNLGYSCIFANAANNQHGPQADLALDRAIQINPKLQAAYYNRAMLHADQAASVSRIRPKSPFADLEKAIQLERDQRPGTGRLYYDAAHLHANAAAILGKRASAGQAANALRVGNTPFETASLIVMELDAHFHHDQAVHYARAALARGFNYESLKSDLWLGPLTKEVGEPPLAAAAPEIALRLLDPVPDSRN
jgi:tetratricopeptide (TPR) repeat protein